MHKEKKVDLQFRISLAETDGIGVVYFANYLAFFEKGHQEYLRHAGINPASFINTGLCLPIRESHCEYNKPIYYDDLIIIQTTLKVFRKNYLEFHYEIVKNGLTEILASGYTRHLIANHALNKLVKLPPEIENALKKFLEK